MIFNFIELLFMYDNEKIVKVYGNVYFSYKN